MVHRKSPDGDEMQGIEWDLFLLGQEGEYNSDRITLAKCTRRVTYYEQQIQDEIKALFHGNSGKVTYIKEEETDPNKVQ